MIPAQRRRDVQVFTEPRLVFQEEDVVRRLGYPVGREPSPRVREALASAREEIPALLEPRVVYKVLPVAFPPDGGARERVLVGSLAIESRAVARTLRGAREAVVFAATLGGGFDRHLERLHGAGDTLRMYLLDGLAVAGLHFLLDCFQQHWAAAGHGVSRRLCPGYAGWPLEDNLRLAQALGADAWGFSLTEGGAILPKKSMAGLFGLGHYPALSFAAPPCRRCPDVRCPSRAV